MKSILTIWVIGILVFLPLAFVKADTTAVLRPTADGTNDSVNWKHTNTDPCDDTGVNCYTQVNESSGASCTNSDGDTSYVQSNTNGAQQTFDIDESSVPDNSTITQIDITVCARKSTTGAANSFQTRRCADGSCVNSGTTLTTGTAYAESTQSHTGLSIIKTATTDIEIGAEIMGSVVNNVRISQISAVITYTPSAPPTPPPPTPTPSPGAGGGVAPTSVFISGQAYPGSKIEFLRKSTIDEIYRNTPEATSTVFADGTFQIQLIALLGGEYLFALRLEDKEGRKTGVIALNADLLSSDKLEAKDIFVPPTIDFEKAIIALGKEINVKGYAAPERKIEIEIGGILKGETKADKDGFWSYATSTAPFRIGDHYARARQTDAGGKASEFSISRTFRVSLLTTPRADFNGDDKVTISDWSIFLFRWGSEDKTLRIKIDMNGDGKIDISDFSIFLKAMKI